MQTPCIKYKGLSPNLQSNNDVHYGKRYCSLSFFENPNHLAAL